MVLVANHYRLYFTTQIKNGLIFCILSGTIHGAETFLVFLMLSLLIFQVFLDYVKERSNHHKLTFKFIKGY